MAAIKKETKKYAKQPHKRPRGDEEVGDGKEVVQPCDTPFTTTARFIQEFDGDDPTIQDILDARTGARDLCKSLAAIECALTENCKKAAFIRIVNVETEGIKKKKEVMIKMTIEWKCVPKPA